MTEAKGQLVYQGWPRDADDVINQLRRAGIEARMETTLVQAPPPPIVGLALYVCRVFVPDKSEAEARVLIGSRSTGFRRHSAASRHKP